MKQNIYQPSFYFGTSYNTKARFCSYWHQINEVLLLHPKSVLEIGLGNGLVSYYLRKAKLYTITLDVDKKLGPNCVGSVTGIPFRDNSFELVAVFEVLEHLPYENFFSALLELRAATKGHVVLSLPDINRVYRIYFHLPKVRKYEILIPIPRMREPIHNFEGDHYWEIGKRNFPLKRICADIKKSGFVIERSYRVFENPYHRFFILKKI